MELRQYKTGITHNFPSLWRESSDIMLKKTGKSYHDYMMEMQVCWEPENNDRNFRGDHSGDSSCISDWEDHKASLLLEVEEDYLPPFCTDSIPDALSGRVGLPLESNCEQQESASTVSSKVSAYYRRWDSVTPGVYIPSYNVQYDGKDEHSEDLQGLREVGEDNFIILIDTFNDENVPSQLGKTLPYPCTNCGQSFQDVSRFQEHKQLHVAGNLYWCSLCGKEFSRAANLRMHKLTHSTERPHKCPVCNKGFIRTADVWRHLRSFHKIERSSFVLGSANIKNQWSVPQQNQDDSWKPEQQGSAARNPGKESSKRYLCSICNKDFSKSNLLSKHKVIHRQEKPYMCKECGMAFVQMARLKRHHQTHSGERPFYCEDCGSTFTRLGSLQRHRRIHTEEKPYSCPYCNLSFSDSGTLKRHERIHTVIQP